MQLNELGRPGYPASILMYHAVSRDGGPFAISPDAFRRQMTQIARTYGIVSLADVGVLLGQAAEPRRAVCITFDDAFRDFADTAFPILQELRIPVTMFVPTGHIGGSNAWDHGAGLTRRELMSASDIRALHDTGFVSFGAHTVDHVRMSSLSTAEMRAQAVTSRQALEDIISAPVKYFSYPYGQLGDFSRRSECVLADAGYSLAVTTHWGTNQWPSERLRLRRIFLDEHDDAERIRAKIDGADDWRTWKEQLGFVARTLRIRPRPFPRFTERAIT